MPNNYDTFDELVEPTKEEPEESWEHYEVWDRINDLIYSLPNYFDTELKIKGVNVTEIFSVGTAFSTIIDSQVVDILNKMRNIWDPENEYSNYSFFRQSQTFPDVLFRNVEDDSDIIFGIELKSWYVLSKEGEPSFRYKVDPDACAKADLLVVIPWILSDVISGKPNLLIPYKGFANYAAEFRNYYWQASRIESDKNHIIRRPTAEDRRPYPESKVEASNTAEDDKGNNFGRIARSGILDDYNEKIKDLDYLGIKIKHWIRFFKAIAETNTDEEIEQKIDKLKSKIEKTYESDSEETIEEKESLLAILNNIELLFNK